MSKRAGTTWKTAPAGAVCCYLCGRYRAPEKLDERRCIDRDGCRRAGVSKLRGAKPLTKREKKALGLA